MSEGTPMTELRSSPHLRAKTRTDVIMRNVVFALLPIVGFAVFAFGLSALCLVAVTTAATVLTEYLSCKLSGRENTTGDFSAVITGMLLGLTLPPGFPLWMAAVGAFAAIGLGKGLFGGLGFNVFNPALVGRAFLMAAFPQAITTWTPPLVSGRFTGFVPSTLAWPFLKAASVTDFVAKAVADGLSEATPLAQIKAGGEFVSEMSLFSLFSGTVGGSTGETAAWLILLCGAYLAFRKMLDWRIPAGMLGSVLVFSSLFYFSDTARYPNPVFMLFSGGLMLGAIFMATDMVVSPTTRFGVWIYGGLLGFLTVLIRLKGGLPEGVMYAILLGNAVTPLLNLYTQPRIYGATKAGSGT